MSNKTVATGLGLLGTTSESFTYDGLSRLLTAQDDDSSVSLVYDSLSRVVSTTQNGKTISRTFDGVGNRLQLTYPGGRSVSYEPDELDRIKSIRAGATVVASYKYVGAGRVKERGYANGTNLAVQYDGVKRVVGYSNGAVSRYEYAYDNMFNKLYEKRLHLNKRDDFGYDSIYRMVKYTKDGDLSGASPARTVAYTLDGVGNRTQVDDNGTVTSYAVNALNQYTAVGGVAQTHDANGNLTNDGTRTFSYDYADRLVHVVTPSVSVSYRYDVFGRRIEKSIGGVAAVRYYYEGDRVIEDRDGADAVSATYVFGNGIDEVLTMTRNGQDYYYHTNAQGSVTEITDATDAIVERYEYDVWGAVTIFTGAGPDSTWHTVDDVVSSSSLIGNRYTFTGREWEPEVSLYYYRARFYDPVTGRFLQRDPIGQDMLGNLYAYVNNTPAVYVDPFGLQERATWWNPLSWPGKLVQLAGEGVSATGLPIIRQGGEIIKGAGNLVESPATLTEGVVTLSGKKIVGSGKQFICGGTDILKGGGLSIKDTGKILWNEFKLIYTFVNLDKGEYVWESAYESVAHLSWGVVANLLGFTWGTTAVMSGGDVQWEHEDVTVIRNGINNLTA